MSALSFKDMVIDQVVAKDSAHNASFKLYTVTKKDKMKIVFTRDSDDYEIVYSLKTGKRLDNIPSRYDGQFYTPEEAQQRLDVENKVKKQLFRDLEQAACNCNLTLVNEIVQQLNDY